MYDIKLIMIFLLLSKYLLDLELINCSLCQQLSDGLKSLTYFVYTIFYLFSRRKVGLNYLICPYLMWKTLSSSSLASGICFQSCTRSGQWAKRKWCLGHYFVMQCFLNLFFSWYLQWIFRHPVVNGQTVHGQRRSVWKLCCTSPCMAILRTKGGTPGTPRTQKGHKIQEAFPNSSLLFPPVHSSHL